MKTTTCLVDEVFLSETVELMNRDSFIQTVTYRHLLVKDETFRKNHWKIFSSKMLIIATQT